MSLFYDYDPDIRTFCRLYLIGVLFLNFIVELLLVLGKEKRLVIGTGSCENLEFCLWDKV